MVISTPRTSVMDGRKSRPPKHAEPTVAVPSTATRRTVFLDRRDLRPAMTGKGRNLMSRRFPRPPRKA